MKLQNTGSSASLWGVAVTLMCTATSISLAQRAADPQTALGAVLESFRAGTDSTLYAKCGTSSLMDVKARWTGLNRDQQVSVSTSLARPVAQTSRLSPSGRFRIHYDTTGFHQPAMLDAFGSRISNSYEEFVDSAAAILDFSWTVEVQQLGYASPPPDAGQGGGNEYDVYIRAQSSGVFGATYWEDTDIIEEGPPQQYSTYIEIDNDFLGYRTSGLDGLRVTCAHELHHAIQVGTSGIWPTVPGFDFYFYELTSVWIEDQVFDSINDYLYDVPDYLSVAGGRGFRISNRALSFTVFGSSGYYGYERAIFAHYLAKRFGRNTIRSIWTTLRTFPFLNASDEVLRSRGSSFASAYSEFNAWNFFTADRSDTLRYYPDGPAYPRLDPHLSVAYAGFQASISSDAYPVSSQYFQFTSANDTVLAVITNVDATGAYDNENSLSGVTVSAHVSGGTGGYQRLSTGITMSLNVLNPDLWQSLYLTSSGAVNASIEKHPSPNPVSISQSASLRLPLSGPHGGLAEVTFFSSSLSRTYVCQVPVAEEFGRYYAIVSSSLLETHVASGIYFVVLRAGDEEHTWKVAVVQ